MTKKVELKQQATKIPTYLTGNDEKNPIFFEKRNVQGAAGNIFPLALCDKINVEFKEVPYNMLKLENDYIKISMLPELGGRIYSALDKKNGYDFIYHNRSIKPQQIGLCGPWISGGIEFNWPQHHRPTTFKNVDWTTEENEDGSKTVWMGENEPFNRTKGMIGVTVYPDKSYIHAKIRLYNRTPYPQTFMWWANLAVSINPQYKAVFPEDLHYSAYHAWVYTNPFPIIKNPFVDPDKSDGIDVRNLGVGGSFFTFDSSYDFLSGYDFGKNAGIVHVADRHIGTGKKMFCWGAKNEFSDAWFKNLSDEDGPYLELMTGVYCCNQPDFSWIMPFEYKTADQYWYPIHDIGKVKSANLNGAIGFEIEDSKIKYALNVTEIREDFRVVITYNDDIIHENIGYISPDTAFSGECDAPNCQPHEIELTLYSKEGENLVSYRPENYVGGENDEVPPPFEPTPFEEEMDDPNEIYLHALHMYQYRHAYFDPMDYLNRALSIDPNHLECNNLAGKILMGRGNFEQAKKHLTVACEIVQKRNPNPYHAEPLYNLGLLLKLMGEYDEAYKLLFKSVWIFAHKSSGYLLISEIDCIRGNYSLALEHIEESILSNGANFRAYKLKAMILRKLGRYEQALKCVEYVNSYDKLDFINIYEKFLILKESSSNGYQESFDTFTKIMRNTPENYIDIAIDYGNAGFYEDAIIILNLGISRKTPSQGNSNFPVIEYYKAYYQHLNNDDNKSPETLKLAKNMSIDGCLHSRLETIAVMKYAIEVDETDAVAPYLLGNIYYGHKYFSEGIKYFELSVDRKATFPTAYRNLAFGYFDKLGKFEEAGKLIEKAFSLDTSDDRVFFELVQYQRNNNVDLKTRLELFEKHPDLIKKDHNSCYKFISTLIENGDYPKAKDTFLARDFYQYEGGETIFVEDWIYCNLYQGKIHLENGEIEKAIEYFLDANKIPKNFNTGKGRYPMAHLYYYLGLSYEALGNSEKAKEHFEIASKDKSMPDMSFYAGLSLEKLGDSDGAAKLYKWLLGKAKKLIENKGRYTYFTGSLVTTLPFEHDKNKNDSVLAHYYNGLAYYGLKEIDKAKTEFKKCLELKASYYLAKEFLEKC